MESFLVNSKAKEVLSQFNLPSYQVFPVNILHKSLIVKDYFLLHFCEDSSSSFSYPNVMLETREMGLKRLSTSISIASPIELKKFLDSKSLDDLLYPKDIAIKNLENFDFLFFNPFWIKNYISTNLKTALIENDISGISFSDTPVDVFKLG